MELEHERGAQHYSHHSVRDLVLTEIQSFKEIFEVKLTETEVHIRDEIADSDVQLFVQRAKNLWNSKPDLLSHMPKREDLKFRALYFGYPDMFSTINLLARYSLYCDQLIVIDPFSIFREMNLRSEHSPFREPQAWVRQIVRDGVYLCSIEDWVRNDLVFATAFPLLFHDPQRRKHQDIMRTRLDRMPPEQFDEIVHEMTETKFYTEFTPTELRTMEPASSDFETLQNLVAEPGWWERVSPYMAGVSKETVLRTLEDMKRQKQQIDTATKRLEKEPRRYEWALKREFEPRMDVMGSGMNLLDAMWFADIMGAHLVTDRRTIWNEILTEQTEEKQSEKVKQSMSALAEAFQKLEFYFLNDIPLNFALQIRNENRLVGFRTYLKDFWNKIRREDQTEDQRLATIQGFRDNLATQYQQFKSEFDEIRKTVLNKIAVAGASGAGAILSGQVGLGIFSLGVLVSALPDEAKRQTKHAQALSVFLDLERR